MLAWALSKMDNKISAVQNKMVDSRKTALANLFQIQKGTRGSYEALSICTAGVRRDCRGATMLKRLLALCGAIVAVIALGGLYVAYPYVTLGRIDRALRAQDQADLEVLVDWPAVRNAFKADMKAGLLFPRDVQGNTDNLKSVGSALGTMMGVAMLDNVIDAAISPQVLFKNYSSDAYSMMDSSFLSPTQFRTDLRPKKGEGKLTVILSLQGLTWRVTRVIVPFLKSPSSFNGVVDVTRKVTS
jgi:hypothetical protein